MHTPSFAIVSTYPPTACGLATFAASLSGGLRDAGIRRVGVVRSVSAADDRKLESDDSVVATLRRDDPSGVRDVAGAVGGFDYVLLQHEYGIFGGPDGDQVIELLDAIQTPVITTLHTVPLYPTPSQRAVLTEVVQRSMATVTMTESARGRLRRIYDVGRSPIVCIPHGATVPRIIPPATEGPPLILTWGLLGPGKGIEWVIDALALVPDLPPEMTYVVAGQTHPNVLRREGDRYREMLRRRADERGVADRVVFDDRYRTPEALLEMVSGATCVVLPYDSTEQITSGVLVDSIATGRPVIATRFPHAVELLSDGAGILVPHADPRSLAAALRVVSTDFSSVAWMAQRAASLAPRHRWSAVARAYVELASLLDVERVDTSPLVSGF